MENKFTDYKYRLGYCVEALPGDGLTKKEMQAHPRYGTEGWGGCDKFVLASILEMEDGSSSTLIGSGQSDGSDISVLPADEIYKIVMLLCRKLAMDGELGKGREGLCWSFFNANVVAMGHPPQDLEKVRKTFGDG